MKNIFWRETAKRHIDNVMTNDDINGNDISNVLMTLSILVA